MTGFRLNGRDVKTAAHPLSRLIDVLREELGDVSVKEGCGEGECGACLVLMNGRAVNSCLVPLAQAEGADIVTVQGLSSTPRGKILVDAFTEHGAVQCGFCTPGLVIAAVDLLRRNPSPTESEIRTAISGNLCRCTGYDLVVKAISAAAREGGGAW
jgi:carbon-monoxide dehydrogenase small subunit